MRIWLIGADQRGGDILRQLAKNQNIDLFVTDAKERPRAVAEGIIAAVDQVEVVTPMNVNTLARRIRPDLILIDAGADQRSLGNVTGGMTFATSLTNEIANASEYPCIVL